MAAYRVAVVSETHQPLQGITVEAVSLNSYPTISATADTSNAGVCTFTGLSGPHWFRPRARRTSATVGERSYHGEVKVQVISLGESMNIDYVVDPDGLGTHTTLADAVAAAITAASTSGEKTIWMCKSVTEGGIDIGGLGSSATITIASHSRYTVVITATAGNDIFDQDSTGGATAGRLLFREVGLAPVSGYAVLDINTGSEVRNLEFENCNFSQSGAYMVRQDGSDSMNAITLRVRHCTGTLAGFYDVGGTSATLAPGTLEAHNNLLTLTAWWDGGSANAAPDVTRVPGGVYTLTNGITLPNNLNDFHWDDLILYYSGSTALFTSGASSSQGDDWSWRNIVIRCTHADSAFLNLGSHNINPHKMVYIENIFGYSTTSPTGTFITIDTDMTNVHVGGIFAPDWSTLYSGPTGVGDDHGLLGGLSDDDHSIYLLLAGRSGGQAAIGGTASGDDLTLESTSHGTKGSVRIVSGSTFEVNDANYAFAIVSSNPRITFDANDYQEYNRGSNYHSWFIGSTEYFRVGGDSQLDFFNGSILETTRVVVSSNGTTVTLSLDQSGGGDLTLIFSDGFTTFDSTPAATVSLTAGSDTSPQTNYVYILQSNTTLTVSTSGWPSEEHAPIAVVILQSAATTQTENALVVHLWHDHVQGSDEQGHYSHIGRWIRQHSATYESGVAQTLTITTNAGVPDNVDFATTSGEVYQMHLHTVPAFDTSTGTNVHVVNDSASPYTTVTDLADLLTDSAGGSMSGKYFNLVIWASVSEETDETHLFINLPSGSYNKQGDATDDVSGFTNFSIPDDFKGTAFLISRLTLRHQSASGGTWTSIQETDLRGLIPNLVAGGGTSAITTEFADNAFKIFDESDVTKLLAFQLSGITTGNTRTLTAPDASGILALTSQSDGTIDHGADVVGLGDDDHTQYTLKSTLAAKGSIYGASGASTPAELGVGANDTILIADSGEATGLKWIGRSGTGELAPVAASEAAGSDDTVPRGDHVHALGIGTTRGDILVWNSTPVASRLALGAAGTVLIGGANDPSYSGSPSLSGTLTVDAINEYTGAAGVIIENVTAKDGSLELHHGTDTISSDEITAPTGGYIIAAAQAGATDDLDGIGGGANGRIIVVRADAGDTITVKHNNAGGGASRKILLNNNADLALVGNDEDCLTLMYDESLDSGNGAWFEIARGETSTAGGHAILDGTIHTDSVADGVTAGSIIIGNDTPKWDELVISVPAANVRNVLGIDNAETTPTWKTALDGTNPADIAESASPGTSLVFAHRDHVHDHPDLAADIHTVYFLVDGSRSMGGDIDLNGNNIDDGGVIFLREQAAADGDVANQGQIWVKTGAPNTLWFTDDGGTDVQLGLGSAHAILDGSVHSDSVADGVTAGSIIIGNDTPKWDELVISVPAVNVRNVLGIDNGETTPSWKTALDGTNPADIAAAASPGTSLVFSHRDHVHDHPDISADLHTVYFLADGTRAMTGDINLDGNNIDNGGVIFLKEQAAADADVAGSGQIWVKSGAPNTLYFTDEDGTDTQLGAGGGGGGVFTRFTSSGTWTKGGSTTGVLVECIGAGGGGGGGEGQAVANYRGNGGGGGGAARVWRWFDADDLGATETVTIGTAGTAGTGGTDTDGAAGGDGGDTTFGSLLTGYGGGAGAGGRSGTALGGDGSGWNDANGPLSGDDGLGLTGALSPAAGAAGGKAEWGGAGGGGAHVITGGKEGGGSVCAAGGGAGGGGVTNENPGLYAAAAAGGASGEWATGGGGAAGATGGGAGGAGSAVTALAGGGGGGGGGNNSATGGVGGAGAQPGGGGGGGGGGTNIGGLAGAGGAGEVRVWEF